MLGSGKDETRVPDKGRLKLPSYASSVLMPIPRMMIVEMDAASFVLYEDSNQTCDANPALKCWATFKRPRWGLDSELSIHAR